MTSDKKIPTSDYDDDVLEFDIDLFRCRDIHYFANLYCLKVVEFYGYFSECRFVEFKSSLILYAGYKDLGIF